MSADVPWFRRSRWEWALEADAPSTARWLLSRCCDENGLDSHGHEAAWKRIARFDSYSDAAMVLRLVKQATGVALAERSRSELDADEHARGLHDHAYITDCPSCRIPTNDEQEASS